MPIIALCSGGLLLSAHAVYCFVLKHILLSTNADYCILLMQIIALYSCRVLLYTLCSFMLVHIWMCNHGDVCIVFLQILHTMSILMHVLFSTLTNYSIVPMQIIVLCSCIFCFELLRTIAYILTVCELCFSVIPITYCIVLMESIALYSWVLWFAIMYFAFYWHCVYGEYCIVLFYCCICIVWIVIFWIIAG